MKLSKQGLVLVLVPLAVELVMVAALAVMLQRSQGEVEKQVTSKAIIARIEKLPKLFDEAALAAASYSISESTSFGAPYVGAARQIEETLAQLNSLMLGDARRKSAFSDFEKAAKEGLIILRRGESRTGLSVEQAQNEARQMYKDLHAVSTSLRSSAERLLSIEEQVQSASPEALLKQQSHLYWIMAIGTAFNIMLAVALVLVFSRGTARRLDLLADNAIRLAAHQPLHLQSAGKDEIARVDRIFHEMAVALEESARKERAIIQNAVDVICSLDREYRFSEINPAALPVWGYRPEELVGQRYMNIVAAEDREQTLAKLSAAIESKENTTYQNRLLRKDGVVIDSLWSVAWSDENKSLFCVAHDNSEARNLERLKQQFVAMISHDLRTPLSSSVLVLEALASGLYGELSDKGKARVDNLQKETGRLIGLINQLLDLEKLEAGKLTLSLENVALQPILDTAADSLRALAAANEVNIEMRPTDLFVRADRERLVQVVINLLGNALKFSPSGEAVTIAVRELEDKVEVSVIDRGPGIPDEDRERIFDRFTQLDNREGSGRKGGTGLGLPIAKMIIEEHKGSIAVEQNNGSGSRFRFTVPRAQRPSA